MEKVKFDLNFCVAQKTTKSITSIFQNLKYKANNILENEY